MLSDDTGVGVDVVMRSVTLTSVVCSDSRWVISGEVAPTEIYDLPQIADSNTNCTNCRLHHKLQTSIANTTINK